MSINTWIDERIRAAVDEAIKDAHDELKADLIAEIQSVEQTLSAKLMTLPGLLGAQIQNVAIDAGAVAAKVVSGVAGQLAAFPQTVIAGVLQGIPNILNPFKGL